jgi:transcriptional regulator with XRE-family HTH domain
MSAAPGEHVSRLSRRPATSRAEMTERIGDLLANFDRLCEEQRMTSEEAVQRGGVAFSTLHRLRTKETFDPSFSTVLKLSAGLGVPPAQLLAGVAALSSRPRAQSPHKATGRKVDPISPNRKVQRA